MTADASDTLYHAFRQSALRFPDKPALISFASGQQWTYTDLLAKTERLAAAFRGKLGVRPGQAVGLLLFNQVEFVLSYFALMALGAVAIPLNYRLTEDDLNAILSDAEAVGLVADEELAGQAIQLAPEGSRWLVLATEVDSGRGMQSATAVMSFASLLTGPTSSDAVFPETTSQQLATLIYTSGTTGRPKGVMLSHGNLLTNARANAAVIKAVPEDVFVTVSPLFHIFGITNIMLTALLQGGTIVLVRKFSPKTILEAITRYRITFLAAVPTMYQMMLPFLSSPNYDMSSLRVCHSGAAPMPVTVFQQVETLFGAPVQEGYGQSEASSIITSNPLHGVRKPGSVGRPIPGVTGAILDDAGQSLPSGEIGEFCIRGDIVMMGYWHRPEETARALRGGWLHTSDMGYFDEDGYLFLVGRRDDMINVGGSKLYPQEVEEVLYRLPGVARCAVVAEPCDTYYQRVAAYVVLQPDTELTVQQVQRYCREALAEYKVPKSVYFVEDIPQGATGKILRYRLKQSGASTSD